MSVSPQRRAVLFPYPSSRMQRLAQWIVTTLEDIADLLTF